MNRLYGAVLEVDNALEEAYSTASTGIKVGIAIGVIGALCLAIYKVF